MTRRAGTQQMPPQAANPPRRTTEANRREPIREKERFTRSGCEGSDLRSSLRWLSLRREPLGKRAPAPEVTRLRAGLAGPVAPSRAAGRASPAPAKWTIAACGNEGAGDDAAGIALLASLAERANEPERFVRVVDFGLELLDRMAGVDLMVLLDAVSSGAEPGTIHFLPAGAAARHRAAVAHGWDVDGVLALARALGRKVPRVVVCGIELASIAPGDALSAPVRGAVERLAAGFPAWLDLLAQLEAPASYPPGAALASADGRDARNRLRGST